jgi:hypothetical protein
MLSCFVIARLKPNRLRRKTMYQLIHSLTASELFKQQLPVFGVSFVFAVLFYKFHSFALECAAFLATWYVLDGLARWLIPTKSPAA